MINLREKDRRAIELIAKEVLPTSTELWAYGSRVKGTCTESSDLDLLIIFPKDSNNEMADKLEKLSQFKASLTDSTIPIFVDVFTWEHIPENFKQNIEKSKQLLMVV